MSSRKSDKLKFLLLVEEIILVVLVVGCSFSPAVSNTEARDAYNDAMQLVEEGSYYLAYQKFGALPISYPEFNFETNPLDEQEKLIPLIAAMEGEEAINLIWDFAESYCADQDQIVPGYFATENSQVNGYFICETFMGFDFNMQNPGDLHYIVLNEESEDSEQKCGPYFDLGGGNASWMYVKSRSAKIISLRDGNVVSTTLFEADAEYECPEVVSFGEGETTRVITDFVTDEEIISWVENELSSLP